MQAYLELSQTRHGQTRWQIYRRSACRSWLQPAELPVNLVVVSLS